jgi:hypothetical protein
MTVEDTDKIDFVTGERRTGDMILTISDHLDWDENEGEHLVVLQKKLNMYLEFIESGQIYAQIPQAAGRKIVIQVMGKYPLSEEAGKFYRLAGKAIESYGYSLRFRQLGSTPNNTN